MIKTIQDDPDLLDLYGNLKVQNNFKVCEGLQTKY